MGDKAEKILFAVDIGSSSVKAMLASVNKNGTLHILGMEEEATKPNSIEKGIITNSSDISASLRTIREKMLNRISHKDELHEAYICLGGRQSQMVTTSVKRDLISKYYFTEKLFEDMKQECFRKIEGKYPEIKVMTADPIMYVLDGEPQDYHPASDQKAQVIEIHYNVYVANKDLLEQTIGAFNRAGISIKQYWVRPKAQLEALVVDEDQANTDGCAIIDCGSQTTTLTVYRNKRHLFSRVLPLGGYNITRDIQTLNVDMRNAERLKIRFGQAAERLVKESQTIAVPSTNPNNERELVNTILLAHNIEMRLGEIFTPVMSVIERLRDDVSVIYLTGGAAQLQGLRDYLQAQTNIPVKYASHADWLDTATDKMCYFPQYSALVGTVLLGHSYDGERFYNSPIRDIKGGKKKKRRTISKIMSDSFSDIKSGLQSLFTDNDNK